MIFGYMYVWYTYFTMITTHIIFLEDCFNKNSECHTRKMKLNDCMVISPKFQSIFTPFSFEQVSCPGKRDFRVCFSYTKLFNSRYKCTHLAKCWRRNQNAQKKNSRKIPFSLNLHFFLFYLLIYCKFDGGIF